MSEHEDSLDKDLMEQAQNWNGDVEELEDMCIAIHAAHKARNRMTAYEVSVVLLGYNMPPFWRAFLETVIALKPGENPSARLESALSWLARAEEAQATLGIPDDRIADLKKRIERLQLLVLPAAEVRAAEQALAKK